jgi:predicted TPR repeat methyltransferase
MNLSDEMNMYSDLTQGMLNRAKEQEDYDALLTNEHQIARDLYGEEKFETIMEHWRENVQEDLNSQK